MPDHIDRGPGATHCEDGSCCTNPAPETTAPAAQQRPMLTEWRDRRSGGDAYRTRFLADGNVDEAESIAANVYRCGSNFFADAWAPGACRPVSSGPFLEAAEGERAADADLVKWYRLPDAPAAQPVEPPRPDEAGTVAVDRVHIGPNCIAALKLFPWTRQATGDATRYYSYVKSRVTGETIAVCDHEHRSRKTGKRDSHMLPIWHNGESEAMDCARRMLADIERGALPESEWTERGRAAVRPAIEPAPPPWQSPPECDGCGDRGDTVLDGSSGIRLCCDQRACARRQAQKRTAREPAPAPGGEVGRHRCQPPVHPGNRVGEECRCLECRATWVWDGRSWVPQDGRPEDTARCWVCAQPGHRGGGFVGRHGWRHSTCQPFPAPGGEVADACAECSGKGVVDVPNYVGMCHHCNGKRVCSCETCEVSRLRAAVTRLAADNARLMAANKKYGQWIVDAENDMQAVRDALELPDGADVLATLRRMLDSATDQHRRACEREVEQERRAEALAADNARLTRELAEADEAAGLYLGFMRELTTTPGKAVCGYCFAPFTPGDEMQAHLRACDKHPMRAVEQECDALRTRLDAAQSEIAAVEKQRDSYWRDLGVAVERAEAAERQRDTVVAARVVVSERLAEADEARGIWFDNCARAQAERDAARAESTRLRSLLAGSLALANEAAGGVPTEDVDLLPRRIEDAVERLRGEATAGRATVLREAAAFARRCVIAGHYMSEMTCSHVAENLERIADAAEVAAPPSGEQGGAT